MKLLVGVGGQVINRKIIGSWGTWIRQAVVGIQWRILWCRQLSSFQHNTPVKAELLIADYCTGDLSGSVDEINTNGWNELLDIPEIRCY